MSQILFYSFQYCILQPTYKMGFVGRLCLIYTQFQIISCELNSFVFPIYFNTRTSCFKVPRIIYFPCISQTQVLFHLYSTLLLTTLSYIPGLPALVFTSHLRKLLRPYISLHLLFLTTSLFTLHKTAQSAESTSHLRTSLFMLRSYSMGKPLNSH